MFAHDDEVVGAAAIGFLKIKERMIFMVRHKYTDAMVNRNYKYEKSRWPPTE